MKNYILIFAVCLIGCTSSVNSQEGETDYHKYVTARKNEQVIKLDMKTRQIVFNESGLTDLMMPTIYGQPGKAITLADIWNFYNDVIEKKYASHPYHNALQIQSIIIAVNRLNLLDQKDDMTRQQLLTYTRDLVKAETFCNFELSVRCIAQVKTIVSKEEFTKMIQTESFKLRFLREGFERELTIPGNEAFHADAKNAIEFFKGLETSFAELK